MQPLENALLRLLEVGATSEAHRMAESLIALQPRSLTALLVCAFCLREAGRDPERLKRILSQIRQVVGSQRAEATPTLQKMMAYLGA
jgi:hypothetical protein